MTRECRTYPKEPAHLAPYVAALGVEKAVDFFLHFGGGELYIRRRCFGDTELARIVGIDGAMALGKIAEDLPRRVPLAKPWLAAVLAARGDSVAQIARTLRASDVSVKRWLAPARPKGTAPDRRGT